MKSNIQESGFKKIVVAVDKFKGSLTSVEVAKAIAEGLRRNHPLVTDQTEILLVPMADGGDGSLNVIEMSLQGSLSKGQDLKRVFVKTIDPIGRAITAPFLLLERDSVRTAFIEMAEVSGLQLLKKEERNPLRASTYGLGEVMRYAIEESQVDKIVLAIGGSATNDGGFGMLTALGFRYKNRLVVNSGGIPAFLSNILEVYNDSVKNICPRLTKVEIQVACDVDNTLLGESGATMVYGAQKGATPQELKNLESAMQNWAEVVQRWSGKEHLLYEVPGTGAAGGVGFALYAVLGGKLLSGWKVFSDLMNLEQEIASADLVITGEGSFDAQSLSGKLPFGVATLCSKHSKPLWLICGQSNVEQAEWKKVGISRVIALNEIEPDIEKCISNATELLMNIKILL